MLDIKQDLKFSNLTTLGIGGPIKEFISVATKEELVEAIKYAKEKKVEYLVIGGGSNLLVSDEGLDKLVIKNEIKGIERSSNNLIVKSGTSLQDLVNFANENSLQDLQNLAGIPGSVGGGLYGNAGAYGQTISDHLVSIKAFDGKDLKEFSKEECGFEYRFSNFKKNHYIILEAIFELTPGDSEELKKESAETIQKRLVKYPSGIKCPGSFFKNIVASTLPESVLNNIPEEKIVYGKLPAGSLLEMVGAKGDTLGEIEIAPYHANLFINKNNGSAKDFHTLAKKYFLKVKEKFGIELEPEVQLVNLPFLKEN